VFHAKHYQDTASLEAPPPTTAGIYPHVSTAFYDLPVIHTETTLQAFLMCDNKEDTLTQSQMFKAHDAAEFIASQASEIRGLEKMGVFTHHYISSLPPRARLLSSIWSYGGSGDLTEC
jgi:hypothetical protein